ncbi:MAG: glycosyltransferase [Ferruginibacter sp.]|nr:glycosyltransferase [Ferruginibacter sp.]
MNQTQPNNISINLPTVAVVILNWNGKQFLEKFIPSVIQSTYKNLQIIVADNASSDDSISFLKQTYPFIKIIVNPVNEGFAKGYNTALKNITSDYFVLLNSDVEVTPNWIEPIIKLMESDNLIAACQPKILEYNNKNKFEYAGASGGFIDKLGYPFARGRIFNTLETDIGQYNTAMPCFWATGAAMFVKASVFDFVNGFDEYFFAHQEEIDLCWRMQLNGFKIYVEPASVVYHVGGGTLPKGNSKKTFLNFRNNLIMLFKNTQKSKLFLLLPTRLFLDTLAAFKGLVSGDTGYFIAIFKAYFYFAQWIIYYRKKNTDKFHTSKTPISIYPKSILWHYYFKNKKKFSEIVT